MLEPRDDVASRYLFAFGNDLVVGPHDGTTSAHPIAGLSLLFLLKQHDVEIRTGNGSLCLPERNG